jgi:protoporphyrinogen oxidase
MHIGILGGGLTGISLQNFINCSCEVLEKEERTGGLCRSFVKDGFTYDIGGHILFSKNQGIMDVIKTVLGENIDNRRRNNKILFKGKYVKYPFENGLGALNKEDIYECLIGYLRNSNPAPSDFKSWIYYTFGDGIAEKYLVPYNNKIWKTPLDDMDLQWVERVPRPPLEDVVKSCLGIETEGYVHQLNFLYPKTGGIESLIKSLIKQNSSITANFNICGIKKKGNRWSVTDGVREKEFDRLVSTIPLQTIIKCLKDVPDNVSKAVEGLRHNAMKVILIGVNNESLMDKSAVYIPQTDITAHRICMMGFFSENNVPSGKSSLIAEITANPGSELDKASDDFLIEKTVNELDKAGIIDKNDVVTTELTPIEYSYAVYDSAYRQNISRVRNYFESIGIHLLGRFGEHEYINMDEVLLRSKRFAETVNKL